MFQKNFAPLAFASLFLKPNIRGETMARYLPGGADLDSADHQV
jgi:hypothetical protein